MIFHSCPKVKRKMKSKCDSQLLEDERLQKRETEKQKVVATQREGRRRKEEQGSERRGGWL